MISLLTIDSQKEKEEYERQQLEEAKRRRIELMESIMKARRAIANSNSKFERKRYQNDIHDMLTDLSSEDYRTLKAYLLRGLQLQLQTRSSLSFRDYSVCMRNFPPFLPPSPTLLSPSAWLEVIRNKIPKPSDWFQDSSVPTRSSGSLFPAVQAAREANLSRTAAEAARELIPFHDPILLPIVLPALIAASDPSNIFADNTRAELLEQSRKLRMANFLRLWHWNRLESQWRRVEILHYAAEVYKRKQKHKKKIDQTPPEASSHQIQGQEAYDVSRFTETPEALIDLWTGNESKYGDVVSDDSFPPSYEANAAARQRHYGNEDWIQFLKHQDLNASSDHVISDDELLEDINEEETQRMHEMDQETTAFASRLASDSYDAQYARDVERTRNLSNLQPVDISSRLQSYNENSLQFHPSPVRGFVGRAVIPVPAGPLYSSATRSEEKGVSQKLAEVKQELHEGDLTQTATKNAFGIGPYGRENVSEKVDPYLWNPCDRVFSEMYSDYYNDPRSNIRVPKNSRFTRTASSKAKAVGFITLNVRIKGGVNYGVIRKKEQKKFIPPLLSQPVYRAKETKGMGSSSGPPTQSLGLTAVPATVRPAAVRASHFPASASGSASSALPRHSQGPGFPTNMLPERTEPVFNSMERQESFTSTDLASVRAQRGSSPVYYSGKATDYDSIAARQQNFQTGTTPPFASPTSRQQSDRTANQSVSMNSIGATDGGSDSGSDGTSRRGGQTVEPNVGVTASPQVHSVHDRYFAAQESESSKPLKAPKTLGSHATGSRGSDAATDGSALAQERQTSVGSTDGGPYTTSEQEAGHERPSVSTFYNFESRNSEASAGPSSPQSDVATGRSPRALKAEALDKTDDKHAPRFSSTTSVEGLPDRER
eukprot:gb/GECG01015946.1/.p1 GENE.gb/GECG01015946.1/~~gb/GECG01015946.1/.p1  ORF type:complete len:884 (+),score=124.19 gb/GECG01015946.1/:1-2652(+)